MIAALTALALALVIGLPIILLGEAARDAREMHNPHHVPTRAAGPQDSEDTEDDLPGFYTSEGVYISPEALRAAQQRLDLNPAAWRRRDGAPRR
uniref:Uncharacterized protein n=1 Tax=Dulem virus 38 TaxID=3145756 RepID=A0AAU8B2B7_9CAUD